MFTLYYGMMYYCSLMAGWNASRLAVRGRLGPAVFLWTTWLILFILVVLTTDTFAF